MPLSLLSLQRMVDLGRIDIMQPIDLTAICNACVIVVDPAKNHYGINLTDEVCSTKALLTTFVDHCWSPTSQVAAEIRHSLSLSQTHSTSTSVN